MVSEISSGAGFQRSVNEDDLADSQTRVFRILLSYAGQVIYPQDECGIRIGDQHPFNTNIYCVSWDCKFEGDSRVVMIATFQYESTPASSGNDDNEEPPDVRPANWSTSVTIEQMPITSWSEVGVDANDNITVGDNNPAVNPVGDMYDGISRLEPVVTIVIEQWEAVDPTRHLLRAGSINQNDEVLGNLIMPAGTIMFRGVRTTPHVEAYGDSIFRGWTASYEFAFRYNERTYWARGTGQVTKPVGWDVVIPVTGYNVYCGFIDDQGAGVEVEYAGQPLKHTGSGKIDGWPNNVQLAEGVAAGTKARAHVLVHSYDNGGASQTPSAQPIALNLNGTPRSSKADPPVYLLRYRTQPTYDFANFNLRIG
ncbi:MAG: hypothetical protein EB117_14225 [Betaproteobacteria bacterium]|nr:hypothetical protein [Betaproteobacteria bacterium]